MYAAIPTERCVAVAGTIEMVVPRQRIAVVKLDSNDAGAIRGLLHIGALGNDERNAPKTFMGVLRAAFMGAVVKGDRIEGFVDIDAVIEVKQNGADALNGRLFSIYSPLLSKPA